MEILEQRDKWYAQFESGWLTHFQSTGKIDWSLYNWPNNKATPSGQAIELASSRLLFVSSAGAYLPASQEPFDTENVLGAYDIRLIPSNTAYTEIAYAHTHYDHAAVDTDPQVLLPLTHLADLVDTGVIGELTTNMVSFMGYQPDISQLLDQTIPAIVAVAKAEKADGVLLVPA